MYKPGVDSTSKDEGELNVAKLLILGVSITYGKLFDVVVYDALACNSKWINLCVNLGIDVIVRAKDNNINSLWQVKRSTNKIEPIEIWEKEKGFESIRVSESTFNMDNVKQPLRFVKFAMKHKDGKHSQIMSDNLHGDEPENLVQNDTRQVGYRELYFQQFERALRS